MSLATDLCLNPNDYFTDEVLWACVGKDVLDVGSNEGGMAEGYLGNGCRVCHLFEPSPRLLELSRQRLSGYSNVVYNQVGVSDTYGRLRDVEFAESWVLRPKGEMPELRVSPGAMAFQPELFDVDLVPLDGYAKAENVGLVKVDVEGYEFRVLRGAESLLKQYKPLVVLELSFYVGKIGDSIPDFIDYLLELGTLRDVHGKLIDADRLVSQFPHHTSCDILIEL